MKIRLDYVRLGSLFLASSARCVQFQSQSQHVTSWKNVAERHIFHIFHALSRQFDIDTSMCWRLLYLAAKFDYHRLHLHTFFIQNIERFLDFALTMSALSYRSLHSFVGKFPPTILWKFTIELRCLTVKAWQSISPCWKLACHEKWILSRSIGVVK